MLSFEQCQQIEKATMGKLEELFKDIDSSLLDVIVPIASRAATIAVAQYDKIIHMDDESH